MAASGCPASTGRARPRSHALRCHRAPAYPPALAVSGARRRRQRRAATLLAPSWGRVAPPRIGSPARPAPQSRDGPARRVQPPHERVAGNQDALAKLDVGNVAALDRRIQATAADVLLANCLVSFIHGKRSGRPLIVHGLRLCHRVFHFVLAIHPGSAISSFMATRLFPVLNSSLIMSSWK